MKKSYIQIFLLSLLSIFSSCNDEWKDEQFERLISFKAPIDNLGVSNIYVRYKNNDKTTFLQPVLVSGSTTNDKNITVRIDVDHDTLGVLNFERFQNREDFYYRELNNSYFSFPSTIDIKSGEDVALLPIDFTLKDIDMAEKWVLPLNILDDASYKVNGRKEHRKALLRVNPFNDYSGIYSGTTLKTVMEGAENETPITKNEIRGYVVDENTIFFYAGNIDEERRDRRDYKVYATFNETGGVSFTADNPNMKFAVNREASYTITERMHETRPYLLRRFLTINNIDYQYTDYTMIPGIEINYKVTGSLSLERQLNTQIPDEDQQIEW